jgi:hypothetical protein
LEPSTRNKRPNASLEAKCEEVVAGFDTRVQSRMTRKDWLPTESSAHGRAMTRRWDADLRPSQLLHDDSFTDVAFSGLSGLARKFVGG